MLFDKNVATGMNTLSVATEIWKTFIFGLKNLIRKVKHRLLLWCMEDNSNSEVGLKLLTRLSLLNESENSKHMLLP